MFIKLYCEYCQEICRCRGIDKIFVCAIISFVVRSAFGFPISAGAICVSWRFADLGYVLREKIQLIGSCSAVAAVVAPG